MHRAIEGLKCATAVHICYGYGIKANIDWKKTLGGEWRQYEEIFPALNDSRIDQISLECANSKVPLELLGLLKDKAVMVGAPLYVEAIFQVFAEGVTQPRQCLEEGRTYRFVDRTVAAERRVRRLLKHGLLRRYTGAAR